MTNVLSFRVRAPKDDDARGQFEELRFIDIVGEIRLSIACRPGNRDDGPFYLILQSPGEPAFAPVCLAPGGESADEFLGMVTVYAFGMLSTLRYASRNSQCLPSALPPIPA